MTDTPTIGHNSVAANTLREYLEQYEALEAERRELLDQQKAIRIEMRGEGYDMKAFAEVVRRRKKKRSDVAEHLSLVEIYERALGIFA